QDNIAPGCCEPDQNRILELCSELGLEDIVRRFGLDEPHATLSTGLSGGQQQLIAIARALYRNPRILIMDEATAAADARTEVRIMNAVERLRKSGSAVILISHRHTTLARCDLVWEIRKGRTVAKN